MGGRKTVSGLESHVGYWLRYVSNQVSRGFAEKVERHGVTVAEWVVMRTLWGETGGVNPSAVAEEIGMTRGAVSKLLDRLAGKGLVKVKVEKGDRRYQVVGLTAAGERLVPVLAGLADENDREFFGVLGEEKRGELMEMMRELVRRHGLKQVPTE